MERHPFIEGFVSACKPADRRPPWQWCEEHVRVDETSPLPGRWRSDASPWVRPVMDDFANNTVRDIAVQCAAQSAKTQTVMNCACWAIAEDPGPAMWVTATKDELRDFLRDRLTPTFEDCAPVKARMAEPTLTGFAFDGMPLYAGWSGSKARLQSKPIRWLFCDEVRNYPPGRLEMVLKRTRSFWNSRRFLISTPGNKGDAMDTAFRAGDQRIWHFECPTCHHLQPLKFEQLKWDSDDTTKPEGKWRFDALAETVRLECAACAHGSGRAKQGEARSGAERPDSDRRMAGICLPFSAKITLQSLFSSSVPRLPFHEEPGRTGKDKPSAVKAVQLR